MGDKKTGSRWIGQGRTLTYKLRGQRQCLKCLKCAKLPKVEKRFTVHGAGRIKESA